MEPFPCLRPLNTRVYWWCMQGAVWVLQFYDTVWQRAVATGWLTIVSLVFLLIVHVWCGGIHAAERAGMSFLLFCSNTCAFKRTKRTYLYTCSLFHDCSFASPSQPIQHTRHRTRHAGDRSSMLWFIIDASRLIPVSQRWVGIL